MLSLALLSRIKNLQMRVLAMFYEPHKRLYLYKIFEFIVYKKCKKWYNKQISMDKYVDISKYIGNFLPVQNIDINDQCYVMLENAIKDGEIKNIAITGQYGSGKSSYIKSYISRFKNNNPILVSLSKFNFDEKNIDESNDKIKARNNDEKDQLLFEIIKQIALSIKPINLIFSNYRYLFKNLYIKFKIIFIVLLFVLSYILLLKYVFISINIKFSNIFQNIINTNSLSSSLYNIFIPIVLGCIILYIILYIFISFNSMSFSLGKGQVNFQLYNDNSNILDKNLSEILYLIEKSKTKCIFFEDIDRFNEKNVFTELRELNSAINTYLSCGKSNYNNIKFVYAIRDDIFKKSTERIKFFDIIIPIVPISTSYNSYDNLIYLINNFRNDYSKDLKDSTIMTVSQFVKDYRMIRSIINEYIVFYSKLKLNSGLKIDDNKLFYMIAYKNIFPLDHFKLYRNNSYSNKLIKIFKEEAENSELSMAINKYYDDNNVKNRIDDRINKIIKEEKEKLETENKVKENINYVFRGIINRFIDEKYGDYINYFYGARISLNDNNYIQNIIALPNSQKELEYNLKIDNPYEVIDSLEDCDFTNKGILNYDIITELLNSDDPKFEIKKINLVKAILNEAENNAEFLGKCYYDSISGDLLFYNIIRLLKENGKLGECLSYYHNTNIYTKMLNFVLFEFDVEDLISIINLDVKNKVSPTLFESISNFDKSDLFKDINIEKIENILIKLNIKFNNLSKLDFNDTVLDLILQNESYEIIPENINYIITVKYVKDEKINDIKSYAAMSKVPALKKYIDNNFIKFMQNVYLVTGIHDESSESFIEIIKNSYSNKDFEEIVSCINSKLTDISIIINNNYNWQNTIRILIKDEKIEINRMNTKLLFTYRGSIPNVDNYFINNIDRIVNINYDLQDKSLVDYLMNLCKNNIQKLNLIFNSEGIFNLQYIINIIKTFKSKDLDLVLNKEKNEILKDELNELSLKVLEKYNFLVIDTDKRRTILLKIHFND